MGPHEALNLKTVTTTALEVAYYEHGPPSGWPVLLLHGFPYDVHAYDDVIAPLVEAGARVFVPYLRGFGPTRFLSAPSAPPCQQAALGMDVVALLDALKVDNAILAGFDWGGLSACVASALWPERVAGLVSYAGYDIIDRKAQRHPAPASLECIMWYQHLFQHERGRECLRLQRRELCRLLWKQWSPTWQWEDGYFERTAASFDNPDFVDVVIATYRHAFANEEGDPALRHLEDRLAARPKITVPAITLDGTNDPLKPGGSADHDPMFIGRHERRTYNVGHAFPMEEPAAFTKAILDVHFWIQQLADNDKH